MGNQRTPSMFSALSESWWALALRGLLAVLFGLAALLLPLESLEAVGRVFGAYAILEGTLLVLIGVRGTRYRGAFIVEGAFGIEWHAPSVFWYVGGTDPDAYEKAKRAGRVAQDIPTNHSPNFAPVIHPTLETGVEAMVVAARAWLSQ